MELIALNCNNCGAELRVGEKAKFVTCKYCDTQLAIHHEDGAAYTDVMEAAKRVEASAEAIEGHIEELADQNERLFVQGEIERLDREWEERSQALMSTGKDGARQVPTRGQAIAMGCVAPLVALPLLVPTLSGADFKAPAFLWIAALIFMALILVLAFRLHSKAVQYEQALAEHQSERDDLVSKLDALQDDDR